ncbi:MAG: hypothetical protein U1A27_14740 [Phycisphaerae bacterium]
MSAPRRRIVVSSALVAFAAGCGAPHAGPAPLFSGLGPYHRVASVQGEPAQRYFDQAMVWMFGFNHDQAIRSFAEAARLDPQCAMAWWGIALCSGPHINNPVVPPERARAAWDAIAQARRRAAHATPLERALIEAAAARYSANFQADRRSLDAAYADAMGKVFAAHRDDPDVGVLYAEALMDLQPWDLWTRDGQPKGRASEIIAVLEGVLARHPRHPGATHLYIHAVEASPRPRRAMAAADVLRTLAPDAGHLVHMPAHIDVRVGHWAAAADQNVAAIAADQRFGRLVPPTGFYHVYMAHNHHFLSFASMMEGRSAVALRAARDMLASVPAEFVRTQAPLIDPYAAIVLDVLMRFGRWDDLLREPPPPAQLPITTALYHFTRGVAQAAKGDLPAAGRERERFAAAARAVPADALMAINRAHDVLEIARGVLDGEIAYREGKIDAAVASLRDAVEREDRLLYMEPPEWIQPVRHTLGAILEDAGRQAEAEQVFRADLERWPENGWALFGLGRSLRSQGRVADAEAVQARFRTTWARADVKIGASCLCVAKGQ